MLNGRFEDQQGRWEQGETSFGTKPTVGIVTVMWVPPKRDPSHHFERCAYFLAPYEEHTFCNSYGTTLRPGSN